jgi:molybdopterin converting factor small subunit
VHEVNGEGDMVGFATQEVATVVRVAIPSPLRSYTGGDAEVRVAIPVLAPEEPPRIRSVLAALDSRFPGFRFRIIDEQGGLRPHIKLFVGGTLQRDLGAPIGEGDEVMIVAALSGG